MRLIGPRRTVLVFALLVAVAPACSSEDDSSAGTSASTTSAASSVRLATTTSAAESGLLDELLPPFEKANDVEVSVQAVGSGRAIELAEQGKADAVLTHAPAAEEVFVNSGAGIDKQRVMTNDFVIVGPSEDPADVSSQPSAADAMAAIAATGSTFVSRGDESGTEERELLLWDAAGVDPAGESWYVKADAGMTATLEEASRLHAYTLTDRATSTVASESLDLDVLFEGGDELLNVYDAYVTNPDVVAGVDATDATKLVEYFGSTQAQEIIGSFGKDKYGTSLFVPVAN